MRWENLFDDLESQLELGTEDADLRAEEERLRLGRLSLRDRLMAVTAENPRPISLRLRDGGAMVVAPVTFGKDWFAGEIVDSRRQHAQAIVPFGAIASISLAADDLRASISPAPASSRLVDRLGLAFVLRDLCRRRSGVRLATTAGILDGTIDRVGRDHLDLAVHEPGTERRGHNVTDVRIVPFDAIVFVRV